jgi:DNA-binding NarL/FixJ family response regulator
MSKRWWRPARLVFLTVHEDAGFARAALDAGGLGYVVKARLASDLLRETSRLAKDQSISQLLSHSVRIAPLHLIKARLVK